MDTRAPRGGGFRPRCGRHGPRRKPWRWRVPIRRPPLAFAGLVRAVEALEYPGQLLLGDARPVVFDSHHELAGPGGGKLLREHLCPRFGGQIGRCSSVSVLFSGSLGPPTGPTPPFKTDWAYPHSITYAGGLA